jgi:hypothetical protein
MNTEQAASRARRDIEKTEAFLRHLTGKALFRRAGYNQISGSGEFIQCAHAFIVPCGVQVTIPEQSRPEAIASAHKVPAEVIQSTK